VKRLACITVLGLFSAIQTMHELAEKAVKAGVAIELGLKIQLPSAEILKKVLQHKYLDSLAQQIGLYASLSNRTLLPVEIYQKVGIALGACPSYMNEPESGWLLDINRQEIVEAILENYPAAIRDLESNGYFKSHRRQNAACLYQIEKKKE
jgi:hypothetical protein